MGGWALGTPHPTSATVRLGISTDWMRFGGVDCSGVSSVILSVSYTAWKMFCQLLIQARTGALSWIPLGISVPMDSLCPPYTPNPGYILLAGTPDTIRREQCQPIPPIGFRRPPQ